MKNGGEILRGIEFTSATHPRCDASPPGSFVSELRFASKCASDLPASTSDHVFRAANNVCVCT